MRTIHILAILVLLALAVPAAPAQAGGVVTVCDEAHLLAALAGGGTVTFTCSGTIALTAEIIIAVDTTIDGSGQTVTISGNNTVRVFTVNSGITLYLNGLTVAYGYTHYGNGGGIYNPGGTVAVSNSTFSDNRAGNSTNDTGGGISSGGLLTVYNSTFSGNSANSGGGIYNWGTLIVSNSTFSSNIAGGYLSGGGGISNNTGTVTVSNSTFSGNNAGSGWGGGIYSNSTLTVSNSTFFGNNAYYGGGINKRTNAGSGMLTVSNSTFSGNTATGGGGIDNDGAAATLKNTIVANSPTGGNCAGPIADGGGNLSYPDTTCPGINADPLLGPLQYNGGSTWTMALGCDIGAVEQVQEPSAVNVSALRAQSVPGTITPTMIAGLLLLVLVAVGAQRRPRHIG